MRYLFIYFAGTMLPSSVCSESARTPGLVLLPDRYGDAQELEVERQRLRVSLFVHRQNVCKEASCTTISADTGNVARSGGTCTREGARHTARRC